MTGTRYKFPNSLGAGEFEAAEERTTRIAFDLPDLDDFLWLPRTILTPCRPAMPAEPDPGVYRIGERVCIRLDYRVTAQWLIVGLLPGDWVHRWADWPELWEWHGGPHVEIHTLVPLPVAATVLPWRGESSYGTPLLVKVGTTGEVDIVIGDQTNLDECAGASCDPGRARALALAIVTAAQRVEEGAC